MSRSFKLFSLLAVSLHVHAQALNGAGLINALQQQGLGTFASTLERANRSESGQRLMNALTDDSQNHTVFVSDNNAFQAPAASDLDDDPAELAAILSYHVLPGNFVNSSNSSTSLDSAISPSVTAGRTFLTNNTFANLEGGKGQVLAWTRNDTSSPIYFLNQSPRVVIQNTTNVGNLLVAVISGLLLPPRNVRQVLETNNLETLVGILNSVDASFYSNGTNQTVGEALEADNTRGFTLFAPTDSAFRTAGDQLNSLKSNEAAVLTVLGNHYINGTSYYSPTLLQSNSASTPFISESGQNFTFATNSSGAYVTNGNTTAKIIKSDVLARNGVVHIVDGVFLNTADDNAKADDAYKSATSAAGQSTTQTGPIGPMATGTTGGGSGNGGGNGRTNAAGGLSTFGFVVGGIAGLVGLVAFCLLG